MTEVMVNYAFNTSKDRNDPRWYENRPDQLDLSTATVWALHLHVPVVDGHDVVEVSDTILEAAQEADSVTGEYTAGDSWTEWGRDEPVENDDYHMVVYFKANNMQAALRAGIMLVVSAELELRTTYDVSLRVTDADWAISTAGDYAEILGPRS